MTTIRLFEESICNYIKDGTIRTPAHLYIGQEAIATGVCACLTDQDLLWGNHRSHGHYIAKGGDINSMMAEIFCKDTGCSSGRGGSMHLIAKDKGILGTVPIVAGTVPLAVGAGLSFKLSKNKHISVAFLGDGATEEGHVIESFNLAALYNIPVLFVIENNLYSSHMHVSQRRREHDLLKLAEAHGIPSYRVDGNDVEKVHELTQDIVSNIRSGKGPAILECMTFRWRGHVGPNWDEDVGVIRKGELSEWLPKDPIKKLRLNLNSEGVDQNTLLDIDDFIKQEIDQMISNVLEANFPKIDTLLNHVFSTQDKA